jgi:hypothetical protein
MREGVAEGDAWRSGVHQLARVGTIEHARLRGHVGKSFYTDEGKMTVNSRRIHLAQRRGGAEERRKTKRRYAERTERTWEEIEWKSNAILECVRKSKNRDTLDSRMMKARACPG